MAQAIAPAFRESRAPEAFHEVPGDDLRSTLTFSRQHPSDCRQRQAFARLDGGPRITLAYGDVVTIDVEPGRHRLRVHNTLFWKTIEFAVEPGEHLECVIINSERWWTAGMAGLLGSAPIFLTVKLNSLV
jgi:hypothetical protein